MASSPQYASERPAVYTVGHSTRTIPEFVELLNKGPVELVVDIRSVPRSRTNPQFNLDALPEALAAWQIGHMQIPELGGLRRKSKIVPPEVNGFWINQSFHNYADYALSGEFRPWPGAPAGGEPDPAVRDHVFGSGLVALSPKNRRRLSPSRGQECLSFDGTRARGAGDADQNGDGDRGCARLSGS